MLRSFTQEKKKNNWLAWLAFFFYLIVLGGMITYTYFSFTYFHRSIYTLVFIIFITALVFLFGFPQWYGTLCSIVGLITKNKVFDKYNEIVRTTIINNSKRVAICYATCDDFIADCFKTAFDQTYKNCDVYVLDDSMDQESINLIKNYLKKSKNKFTIVRRNGEGWSNKAGNINYWLDKYSKKYDYFAIMDADTYLDKDFVKNSLKYFNTYNDIFVVQAGIRSIRGNKNCFQDMITPNYTHDYHFYTKQSAIVSEYVTTYYEGHACLFSLDVFRKTKFRFQNLGADDFPATIEMLKNGYRAIIAPNILCEDQASPNYFAWKKTNIKWEDAMKEYLVKCGPKLFFRSKIRLFDKFYLWYWAALGILNPVLILSIVGISFVPLYGIEYGYSLELLKQWPLIAWVVSLIFIGMQSAVSPAISLIKRKTFGKTIRVQLLQAMFYFSIIPSQFLKFFTMIFTNKSLSVSVKANRKIKRSEAIGKNLFDILFYMAFFGYIIFTCVWTRHWLFALNPILWIMFASWISIFFMPTMSNKEYIQK